MTTILTPRRERWLLLTLAGVQFTHILDFMIMMPLGLDCPVGCHRAPAPCPTCRKNRPQPN